MVVFIFWILLSSLIGYLGSEKSIGGVAAFFISLLLSPLIGLIVVLADSQKKVIPLNPWKKLVEDAEIEKYKGNNHAAIDKYKEAMYHLEKLIESFPPKNDERRLLTERLDGLRSIVKKLE